MVGPEAFEEVRYLAHLRQLDALDQIPVIADAFAELTGRASGGLVHPYRTADADTIVVAMGSVLGTIKDAVDRRREAGDRVGVLGITSFRPFPIAAVRRALSGARRVVVIEKAFSLGMGGVLATDVSMATLGSSAVLSTVVAGLGGRPIPRRSVEETIERAGRDQLTPLSFLDLDDGIIERERGRMARTRRSGPFAENVLRDLRQVKEGRP